MALSFSALDSGNSTLANLPLMASIVDPATQQVIASYPYTQNLAVGVPYNGGVSWTSSGTPGANYVAVLSATVGGSSTSANRMMAEVAMAVQLFSRATARTGPRSRRDAIAAATA